MVAWVYCSGVSVCGAYACGAECSATCNTEHTRERLAYTIPTVNAPDCAESRASLCPSQIFHPKNQTHATRDSGSPNPKRCEQTIRHKHKRCLSLKDFSLFPAVLPRSACAYYKHTAAATTMRGARATPPHTRSCTGVAYLEICYIRTSAPAPQHTHTSHHTGRFPHDDDDGRANGSRWNGWLRVEVPIGCSREALEVKQPATTRH